MKITNIKAVYPKYKAIPPSWRTHLWQIVVKIETDTGIVGYGYGGGGKASVEVINHHFSEILVNQNSFAIIHKPQTIEENINLDLIPNWLN